LPALESLGGVAALVCGIVAAMRRKQAIGGWLFYFFCQVLLGLTLAIATTHWTMHAPREWSDPVRYFLFTLASLSRVVLLVAVAAVSLLLAETRDGQWVTALQYALAAYAFVTLLKLPVDAYCFPSALSRDTGSLAFPVVWMAYFTTSLRVRRVFREKSWLSSS
jgi:membrane-bound metal-dependent hydrolase YbcI (DUF457 family)